MFSHYHHLVDSSYYWIPERLKRNSLKSHNINLLGWHSDLRITSQSDSVFNRSSKNSLTKIHPNLVFWLLAFQNLKWTLATMIKASVILIFSNFPTILSYFTL